MTVRGILQHAAAAAALVATYCVMALLAVDVGAVFAGMDVAPDQAILGGLVAGIGGRLVGKAAAWVGKAVSGGARVATNNPVATGAAIAGAGMILPTLNPFGGGTLTAGGSLVPQPQEGLIGRTISRILPGGKTGYEFQAATEYTDKIGRPIAVHPARAERYVSPPGYVIVNYEGKTVSMLKGVAIRMGLYKPDPKPPISGWDARAIRRADAAKKRIGKLARKSGYTCSSKCGSKRK